LGITHRITLSFLRDSPANFHLRKGVKYFEQLQTDEAIKEFNLALEIDEKNPKTYHYLGLAYERLGELDTALDMLEKINEAERYYTEEGIKQVIESIENVLKTTQN